MMEGTRPKIVADPHIPFLKGVLEPYADVVYVDGINITKEDVKDADAMMIRLRTQCNEDLLGDSNVSIIATTAVGTDHIDFDFCRRNAIEVYNAQGSTANGVMQYVFSALYGVASRKAIKMDGYVFGVIGAGNVGLQVARVAKYLGFTVKVYDPVRIPEEFAEDMATLDEMLEVADVITIHTSLRDGNKGMCNKGFFDKMKPGAFFINACRGEFVVEEDLMAAIPKLGGVILDSWLHEPNINKELMNMVDIATPHISGYTLNTKMKGTASVVRTVAHKFGIEELFDFYPEPEGYETIDDVGLDLKGKNQGEITAIFQYNYPIFTDDFMFRMEPDAFDKMRDDYQPRREIYIKELEKYNTKYYK
jgi:erythronate-4-phosphate dehydrogenase